MNLHAAEAGGITIDQQLHPSEKLNLHAAEAGGITIDQQLHPSEKLKLHAAEAGGITIDQQLHPSEKLTLHAAKAGGISPSISSSNSSGTRPDLPTSRHLRQYLQPTFPNQRKANMERRTTSWFSPNLQTQMPLVAYGHAGPPLLMFPTAAADYLEYERFYLVDSIKPFIESGKLRAYSINSVNRYSLLNEQMPAPMKAELLTRYDRYITDEVLPLIRKDCGDGESRPITTGASLGAFLAANEYFKHPDLFRGVIAMSGSYDVRSYLKGHYDDNVYFNNPVDYLSNLNDDYYLPILQRADKILIMSGQGNYEAPDRSQTLSDVLNAKGIPHKLDLWGPDVDHDWPWWRKMLPHALGLML